MRLATLAPIALVVLSKLLTIFCVFVPRFVAILSVVLLRFSTIESVASLKFSLNVAFVCTRDSLIFCVVSPSASAVSLSIELSDFVVTTICDSISLLNAINVVLESSKLSSSVLVVLPSNTSKFSTAFIICCSNVSEFFVKLSLVFSPNSAKWWLAFSTTLPISCVWRISTSSLRFA